MSPENLQCTEEPNMYFHCTTGKWRENRGVASYAEMKARTMAVARGERRVAPSEPKVWFTSTESFATVLSAGEVRITGSKGDLPRAPCRRLGRKIDYARRSQFCSELAEGVGF